MDERVDSKRSWLADETRSLMFDRDGDGCGYRLGNYVIGRDPFELALFHDFLLSIHSENCCNSDLVGWIPCGVSMFILHCLRVLLGC